MPIPLSLYIHIPWCVQKCPYCDFNSHALRTTLPESDYIHRLLNDLQTDKLRFNEQRPLASIFIGGGTPSLFSGGSIKQLLDGIARQFTFSDNIEITLEANPGTLDEQHFAGYYRAGINRLSIGVQSFHNQQLKQLGRIHRADDAVRTVKTAQDIGFDNINIDLMFGLPEQTAAQALSDIDRGIALNTEHLSYYQLTLEPNTAFARRPPCLPADDSIDERFVAAANILQQNGFHRYEVSAWSRGRQSQHNRNYWQYGDYLGIGAGAHGKITLVQNGKRQIIRTTKPRAPKIYLGNFTDDERIVREDEKAFEFMLNTLRLADGFPRRLIRDRGLMDETTVLPTLRHLANKGLLIITPDSIYPTELGKRFINDMVEAFL
ncbi:MAG: YggW family oxidoreductase [Gammaproteobacteria bacterium]|nr:MAG: YggW family oxidoreductase [Gammaproteobacteria bacterium]